MQISRMVGRVLGKLGHIFTCTSRRLQQSSERQIVQRWFEDQGDRTLRLDYPLDAGSLVFDVGGYEGQWASDVFSMYCCTIHIFEPVSEFADRIQQRFSNNDRIHVHRFGLLNENRVLRISVSQDGSSFYRNGSDLRYARLVKASDFVLDHQIEAIDLMKINIEGGEYELLEHLVDSGLVTRIDNIQVQFHSFVPDAKNRMATIQQKLHETHRLTYQYPFVWENWRLQ